MRHICWSGIVLLGVVAVALFVIPIVDPWSPLNCEHLNVDLCTGRCRISRYVGFYKISERVEETSLSRVVPAELIDGVLPHWERTSTSSPWAGHSPHYRFHSAFSQIQELELLWQGAKIDESTTKRCRRKHR